MKTIIKRSTFPLSPLKELFTHPSQMQEVEQKVELDDLGCLLQPIFCSSVKNPKKTTKKLKSNVAQFPLFQRSERS